MQTARVAVLAYPDTPFIEAMVLGVPTIGIWDTKLWNWTDDAQKPFDALAAAGVVFSDPRCRGGEARRGLSACAGWWREPEIQAARRLFLERFAIGGDWREPWTRTLKELEHEG